MRKFILFVFISMFAVVSYADHAKHDELILGFMPYLASQMVLKKYQPLADYLSKELHKKVVISIAKDYNEHNRATGEDEYDISFLGGSPYVVVTDKYGLKPLLARFEFNNKPYFRSVLYTSENSGINKLSDLKGKKVVFGSKRSTLSTQVPMYVLLDAGVQLSDIKYSFLNNQENVYISVLLGEYQAGSASEDVFSEIKSHGLRVIEYSPYLSTHVFVTSNKMEKSLQDKIKNALIKLKSLPEGKKIFKSISPVLTGFVEAKDSDYDLHRDILKSVLPILE